MPQSHKCDCKTSTSKEKLVKTEHENPCAGKARQDPCISLKDQLAGDLILSFPPPLFQAHREPNTRQSYFCPHQAHVQQEARWTGSGLRTSLQALNHCSPSPLSTPLLPSSAMWELSSVLPQLISFAILLSSQNNIISESHSLINHFKHWYFSFSDSFRRFPQHQQTDPKHDTPSWSLYSTSKSVHHT